MPRLAYSGVADSEWQPKIIDGLAVYRRRRPGQPRVVLVHGGMDRGGSFIKATRRLPDLETIRYDRRGYGRSFDAGVGNSLDEQVQDLLRVIDDEPAVAVGHSLGGLIALTAAQRHPDLIPSVAAFEAPMPWMDWWPKNSAGGRVINADESEGATSAGERFMRAMIGDAHWERLPEGTRESRRRESAALLSDLRSIRTPEPPFTFDGFAVPVLSGYGSASSPHHIASAEELARRVPGAELMVIEGASHGAHFTHPGPFAEFIARAVARSGATGPG